VFSHPNLNYLGFGNCMPGFESRFCLCSKESKCSLDRICSPSRVRGENCKDEILNQVQNDGKERPLPCRRCLPFEMTVVRWIFKPARPELNRRTEYFRISPLKSLRVHGLDIVSLFAKIRPISLFGNLVRNSLPASAWVPGAIRLG
jgi:hypothetical protein